MKFPLIKKLEDRGMIKYTDGAYHQTDNNCFEIASWLAQKLNFVIPTSKELNEWISRFKALMLWEKEEYKKKIFQAEACLVIREPDYIRGFISDAHIAFELRGKELNFGANDKDGFKVSVRIPLSKHS